MGVCAVIRSNTVTKLPALFKTDNLIFNLLFFFFLSFPSLVFHITITFPKSIGVNKMTKIIIQQKIDDINDINSQKKIHKE